MKPLNRPMFRYGGPIKEGVMSGIREPKKNGGLSKQFNTGLVGDERYPKTDGREHHVAFIPPLVAAANIAARVLPAAYRGFKASRYLNPNAATTGQKIKNFFLPRKSLSAPMAKTGEGVGFKIGSFARTNPGTTFGIASAVPQAGYGAYNLGKAGIKGAPDLAKNYIDMVLPGEQFREKDGSPKTDASGVSNINKAKKAIGMPENLTYRASTDASKKGGGVELSAKERRAKNVERYRDIMDIKGMNKDAAYNSLIAASQAINQSGDFKGDIKSGKLINEIIQATSKQFDKPKATKDAIDTLILKGEIEKDIKASDPSNAQLNALRDLQGKKLQKELNPSFNTLKAGFAKDNKGQSGIDLAAGTYAANNGIDFKGNIISKSEFNDILKDLKAKTKGLDEDLIIKNYTEEIIKTQEAPDGAYTVGDKIVIIQDKQVIAVE